MAFSSFACRAHMQLPLCPKQGTTLRDFENSAMGSSSQSVELHNLLTVAPYSLHPMFLAAYNSPRNHCAELSNYWCNGQCNSFLGMFHFKDASSTPAHAAKLYNVQIFLSLFSPFPKFCHFFYIFAIFVAFLLKMRSKLHNRENQVIIYFKKSSKFQKTFENLKKKLE